MPTLRFSSLSFAAILVSNANAAPAPQASASSASAVSVTSTAVVELPTSVPSDAFNVPADFPSIGFETAFSWQYGDEFSQNLVSSLAKRLSSPPIIRIGGTSGDYIKYNPNQDKPTDCDENFDGCPNNSNSHWILGKPYFDHLEKFKDAHFTIQAPLSPEEPHINETNILAYVQGAIEKIGIERVNAIALGNEVQWYEPDAKSYVDHYNQMQEIIRNAIGSPSENGKLFTALDTPDYRDDGPVKFSVEDAFEAGLKDSKELKYVAEHYYQVGNDDPRELQKGLLNHTVISNKLDQYIPAIKAAHANGAEYILSETGGVLAYKDPTDAGFAAALWAVDFQLYAMSIGVSRITGVQRPTAKRSLWMPEGVDGVTAQVQGPWYGLPFVADFLGNVDIDSRNVVNIDLNSHSLSAYAIFTDGKLARVAILNTRRWGDEAGKPRSSVKVTIPKFESAQGKVEVKRLKADAGVQAGGFDVNRKNITLGGKQWSYKDGKGLEVGTAQSDWIQPGDNGSYEVEIPDSEAIILYGAPTEQ